MFCCSSAFFITRGRVHSWVEQSSHQGFLSKSPNLCSSQTGLSLCTVGTSSAFLQTADNICLLTCTVTCRTLLTPPYDPPVPRPRSSPQTPEHNSVPPPQAASSQCKLNLHFIYDAVWNRPHSVLLMFIRGVALNVFYFRFFLWLTFPFGEKKTPVQTRRSEVVWWEAVGVFPMMMMMMICSELCCDALFDLTSIIGPGSVSNAEHRCESRFPDFLAGLAFVLFWKVHCCFCTVPVLLRLQITPELLNQVTWGVWHDQTLTRLRASVSAAAAAERMPFYANFDNRRVEAFFWYASAFIFTFSCETRVTFFSLGVLADADARARRLGVKRCSDHLRSNGLFRIRRFFHGCMKKNWTPVLHWHGAVCGAVLPQNASRWLVEVACGFGVTSPQVRPALGSNMNAVDGLCFFLGSYPNFDLISTLSVERRRNIIEKAVLALSGSWVKREIAALIGSALFSDCLIHILPRFRWCRATEQIWASALHQLSEYIHGLGSSL